MKAAPMSKKVKRKVHSLTNSSYENDYSPPNDQRFGRGSGRRRNSANLCGAERFEGRRHDNTETGRSENRYPKPPFKEQQQPWPGLASKMDPRPDHGEKVTKARVVCLVAKRSSAAAIPEWAGAQRSPLREKALTSRSIIFQPSNRTPTK